MALSNEKIKFFMQRLLLSRMRILCNHGFYGLLLMHIKYAIDENVPTACTDGRCITFGTKFLEELTDEEIDFVMMHEILHVVLQHCLRGAKFENERYNIAADIVVNSNILLENNMNLNSITLKNYGPSMHIAPNGKEGHLFTAEEVYDMLPAKKFKKTTAIPIKGGLGESDPSNKNANEATWWDTGRAEKKQGKRPRILDSNNQTWDDHSHWGEYEEDDVLRDVWVKNFNEACEAISISEASSNRGTLPLFAKRLLEKLKKAQTDWRTILNEFIQMEVNDYSFSPPDRRFDESPFFLPDFNELGETGDVEDILFMIDTSGSMSDKMITAAYSEVKGAIDQYDGKLKGWLGFFDAAIIEPIPFSNVEEFSVIKPAGGGGTDFQIIFEYVQQNMEDKKPACIIILTDGYAPFPQEHLADEIPVLWLLNNENIQPPWGKVARIKV